MSLYDLPNMTDGMDSNLIQLVSTVPAFIPSMLMFIFFVVFLGGVTAQRSRVGYADHAMWATMASFSTMLVTLILSLKSGLVNLTTLSIVIAITIFSGIWLFLSRGRGER